MNDQEIIDKIKDALSGWDFDNIKVVAEGKAKMGAFILASCYIDHLACFYYNKDGTRTTYENFVQKWLPQYNAKDLYKSLRCKLVHNYTEGGKYTFVHEKPQLHLRKDGNKTIVNLENFIAELEEVQKRFFELLDSPGACRENAIRRHKSVGILGSTQIQPDHIITNHMSYTGTSAT